jgi:putative transposase
MTYTPEELRDYLESEYGVLYKSKQSYYDLLHEGGINWKKNENVNPERDEEKVAAQRKIIKDKIRESEEDIRKGDVVVLMEDESHLLWGDTVGYVWGRKNEKVGVPMSNEKERQTYYGAVNVLSGEFHILPYESGNGVNTVSFVKYLEEICKDAKIILIWDGATYHKYGEMRRYLEEINGGLNEKDWKVTCLLFPPYAPDQNPVEEIWRKGKNFLRRHFYENKTFRQVKESFFDFLKEQIFSFPKLKSYIS